MTLRIAWLGPWNATSAIARFGVEVVEEMERRGYEVDVYRTETGRALTLAALPGARSVRPLAPKVLKRLRRRYDHVYANIGDNDEFHGALVDALDGITPIGIFHDGYLLSLAHAYMIRKGFDEDQQRMFFQSVYGKDAFPEGVPIWQRTQTALAEQMPCTEWLAKLVCGAVAHSDVWRQRIEVNCPGPVSVLPLPYPDIGELPSLPVPGRIRIATFGHANPNKRIDEVIKAIAASDRLRNACQYAVYGKVTDDEAARIAALARRLKVSPPRFSGWVDDEELIDAMTATDVVACLRYPILEGGSASLVTAMLSGRPTLVSDHGHYRLPEGLALPCRPGDEAGDIARHLNWVLDNPTEATEMGRRARKFALAHYSAKRYVDGLIPLADKAVGLAPILATAKQFGYFLGQIGVAPDDPAVDRVVSSLSSAKQASGVTM